MLFQMWFWSVHRIDHFGINQLVCLLVYTVSVIFDYYCRGSELSYIKVGFSLQLLMRELGSFTCLRMALSEPPFIA